MQLSTVIYGICFFGVSIFNSFPIEINDLYEKFLSIFFTSTSYTKSSTCNEHLEDSDIKYGLDKDVKSGFWSELSIIALILFC